MRNSSSDTANPSSLHLATTQHDMQLRNILDSGRQAFVAAASYNLGKV